jgi:PhnB protein
MRPGFHSISPYLIARDAPAMIEFLKQVFGATELMRMPGPDGKLMHAEVQIGDSQIMLADEHPDMGYLSPISQGNRSTVGFMLYVEDADSVYAKALAAGARSISPMENKEYGRTGGVDDSSGYRWYITTHK